MNAELLLMFILGCDRTHLYAHPERELTNDEAHRYEAVLAERTRGFPAQYITGHQEFWGMDLIVTPAVLIPRPETEHLVESVLECVAKDNLMDDLRIADVGTGSGCIALALAKELPQAQIHAVDISPGALEIARINAARHQLQTRIQFHEADLLTGFAPGFFDFVVSNPRTAVFAGSTGTEVIARLIPQAHTVLKSGGRLVMEISGTIAEESRLLLQGWREVEFKLDLQSIQRVAVAKK
jgi:release factor glutamine methyltransferase